MDTGDTAWVLISTALILFMTPGLAFFYAGMVRNNRYQIAYHVGASESVVPRFLELPTDACYAEVCSGSSDLELGAVSSLAAIQTPDQHVQLIVVDAVTAEDQPTSHRLLALAYRLESVPGDGPCRRA